MGPGGGGVKGSSTLIGLRTGVVRGPKLFGMKGCNQTLPERRQVFWRAAKKSPGKKGTDLV